MSLSQKLEARCNMAAAARRRQSDNLGFKVVIASIAALIASGGAVLGIGAWSGNLSARVDAHTMLPMHAGARSDFATVNQRVATELQQIRQDVGKIRQELAYIKARVDIMGHDGRRSQSMPSAPFGGPALGDDE